MVRLLCIFLMLKVVLAEDGDASSDTTEEKDCITGVMVTNPSDCTKFDTCVHNKWVTMSCGRGTVFDQTKLVCVHGKKSECDKAKHGTTVKNIIKKEMTSLRPVSTKDPTERPSLTYNPTFASKRESPSSQSANTFADFTGFRTQLDQCYDENNRSKMTETLATGSHVSNDIIESCHRSCTQGQSSSVSISCTAFEVRLVGGNQQGHGNANVNCRLYNSKLDRQKIKNCTQISLVKNGILYVKRKALMVQNSTTAILETSTKTTETTDVTEAPRPDTNNELNVNTTRKAELLVAKYGKAKNSNEDCPPAQGLVMINGSRSVIDCGSICMYKDACITFSFLNRKCVIYGIACKVNNSGIAWSKEIWPESEG